MNTTERIENRGLIFETNTIGEFKNALELLSQFKSGVVYNIPDYMWEVEELDREKYLFAMNDGTVGYINKFYIATEYPEGLTRAGWTVIGLKD